MHFHSTNESEIMEKGLLIKSPHIENILSGLKTWEMRSKPTKVRGKIALIRSGSGKIVGDAKLIDCIGPLTMEDKRANMEKHRISPERLELPEVAKYVYAWVLADAVEYAKPVPYDHPSGAVIWVDLK